MTEDKNPLPSGFKVEEGNVIFGDREYVIPISKIDKVYSSYGFMIQVGSELYHYVFDNEEAVQAAIQVIEQHRKALETKNDQ